MLATQVDLLLLNRWLDPATLGAYGLALNLAAKVEVVHHSLNTALLPAASAARGDETVDSYLRRGLIRGALLAIALLPIFPLADPLILFFYGPAYAQAVLLFRLLLGVAVFDLLVSPLLLLAFTFNRPRLLAGADAVRVGTLTTLAIVLIPGHGPVGAVAARFAARFAGAVFTLALLSRSRRMGAPVSPAD
jgi:O-antigen/teichoic acid export membrane protein